MPIAEIEPVDVLAAIRKIEARGTMESARRTLQLAGAVFRHGVATARLRSDPTRDLQGALITPRAKNYSAITDASRVGELLRAIDDYQGQGLTKRALQIAAHVFVRPGELRHAEWSEIDLNEGVWTIPAEKMKMRKAHVVPLSRQVAELFAEIYPATGPTGYVFPSLRTRARPMSENTLNAALRRLGFSKDEMTAHGFRSMASSLLNESGKWHLTLSSAPLPMATATGCAAPITAQPTGMSASKWPSGGVTTSTCCARVRTSCRSRRARHRLGAL
jgi:integrase